MNHNFFQGVALDDKESLKVSSIILNTNCHKHIKTSTWKFLSWISFLPYISYILRWATRQPRTSCRSHIVVCVCSVHPYNLSACILLLEWKIMVSVCYRHHVIIIHHHLTHSLAFCKTFLSPCDHRHFYFLYAKVWIFIIYWVGCLKEMSHR